MGAEREPIGPGATGHGHARPAQDRPNPIEKRVAGKAKSQRGLARRGQCKDRVDIFEQSGLFLAGLVGAGLGGAAVAAFYDGTQFPMVLATLFSAAALFLCFWVLVWPGRETAPD